MSWRREHNWLHRLATRATLAMTSRMSLRSANTRSPCAHKRGTRMDNSTFWSYFPAYLLWLTLAPSTLVSRTQSRIACIIRRALDRKNGAKCWKPDVAKRFPKRRIPICLHCIFCGLRRSNVQYDPKTRILVEKAKASSGKQEASSSHLTSSKMDIGSQPTAS